MDVACVPRPHPILKERPIHLVPFVLFASQIQEAASRGLKFVGVIPQHRGPVNSAGSSPPGEARDAKKELGGCGEKESPGAVDVCSAPGQMHGSAEPNQGPGEEAPGARQPSLPSAEGDGAGLSPCGVSQALDGQDGDPSEVHEEPLSGSKYVGAGTFDLLKERLTAFQ